jgi:hypothetical protein
LCQLNGARHWWWCGSWRLQSGIQHDPSNHIHDSWLCAVVNLKPHPKLEEFWNLFSKFGKEFWDFKKQKWDDTIASPLGFRTLAFDELGDCGRARLQRLGSDDISFLEVRMLLIKVWDCRNRMISNLEAKETCFYRQKYKVCERMR